VTVRRADRGRTACRRSSPSAFGPDTEGAVPQACDGGSRDDNPLPPALPGPGTADVRVERRGVSRRPSSPRPPQALVLRDAFRARSHRAAESHRRPSRGSPASDWRGCDQRHQQATARGLGDKCRMAERMDEFPQPGHPGTAVPGEERLGSRLVGGFPRSDLHHINVTVAGGNTATRDDRQVAFRPHRNPANSPSQPSTLP